MSVKVLDVSGGMDGQTRTYRVLWQVTMGSDSDGPGLAMRRVPRLYTSYFYGNEGDTRAFLMSKSASRPEGAKAKNLWHVSGEYRTLTREEKDRMKHPLKRPAQISDSSNIFSSIAIVDRFGKPILNKAQTPFDPPVEKDDSRQVITITKNLPARIASESYTNRINNGPFLGRPKWTWKIQDFQQHDEYEEFGEPPGAQEVHFWVATVSFEFDINTWVKSTLNAGRYEIDPAAARNPVAILGGDGQPVAEPWPLDNAGAMIPPGNLPGAETYIDSEVYLLANFNALRLLP